MRKKGQSTGIFNSLVLHTNSTVDFGFVGIYDTVFDVSMAMFVTVWDEMTNRRQNVGHGL